MTTHRPMVPIVIAFILGIMIMTQSPLSVAMAWIVVSAMWLVAMVFFPRQKIICILLMFIGLGMVRVMVWQARGPDHIAYKARYWRGEVMAVEGVVTTPVELRNWRGGIKSTFGLTVRHVGSSAVRERVSGRVWCQVFRPIDLLPGDKIRIEGKVHHAFTGDDGRFSYRQFLSDQGYSRVLSVRRNGRVDRLEKTRSVAAWAVYAQRYASHIFEKHLSPNEAGMMKALVLGDRHAIPEHIRELFVRTGTAHVLAISGLHVGLIALVLVMVLRLGPWPRWVAYVAMVFLLGGYAMMTGFRPSVVRAWIMVSVVFLGFAWEREGDVYNNLSLAAFILLLINPMHIRMISFQLSFVSVIAILVFQPFIYRLLSTGWWGNYPLGRGLANAVAVSLAAEIGIAPLIAYYFDLLTPVGPLANVWIIPLMMGVLILGLGLLALGSVSALLAGWWAMLIKIGLNLTSFIAYGLSHIPGAYVWVESPSLRWLYAYYGLVLLTSWCVRNHLFKKNDPGLSKSGKKYTTGGNKTFAK